MAQLQRASAPRPSVYQLLDAAVDELDDVKRELSLGIRNAQHYNELETRTAAACKKARDAWRKGALR